MTITAESVIKKTLSEIILSFRNIPYPNFHDSVRIRILERGMGEGVIL
jgi:hypothetical protein